MKQNKSLLFALLLSLSCGAVSANAGADEAVPQVDLTGKDLTQISTDDFSPEFIELMDGLKKYSGIAMYPAELTINGKKESCMLFKNRNEADAFIRGAKKPYPETGTEENVYHGLNLIDALAEVYACFQLGNTDEAVIKHTAALSLLANIGQIGKLTQFSSTPTSMTLQTVFPAFYTYKEYKKYSNAKALSAKNKANRIGLIKKATLILANLLSAAVTFESLSSNSSAVQNLNFQGCLMRQQQIARLNQRFIPAAIVSLCTRLYRYHLELKDLDKYQNVVTEKEEDVQVVDELFDDADEDGEENGEDAEAEIVDCEDVQDEDSVETEESSDQVGNDSIVENDSVDEDEEEITFE